MDTFTNKRYYTANYTSRQTGIPYYYDTEAERDVSGLAKPMLKNASWVAHKVAQGDNLDKLALKYYNNPTYWWVIAYFNNIPDSLEDIVNKYTVLKIPNITSIEFGDLR